MSRAERGPETPASDHGAFRPVSPYSLLRMDLHSTRILTVGAFYYVHSTE